jgi:hypothetical protein
MNLRSSLHLVLCFAPMVFAATPGKIKFNRDIQPILSENCTYCHGPDKKHREADLRLDVREAAIEAGAIVPGDPSKSELMARILTEDQDDLMPPPESHKVLKPEQKEMLKHWIEQGAEYEAHWAYTPLVKPAVPSKDANPIDAFIHAELAERNIKPSAQADAATLIRRLSLDLTGLPPTPTEVESFKTEFAQYSETNIQKLTDRLLKTPQHGERMAVWWLDVARFTDTVGFHGDQNQRIFPYRDYVIKSFTENKRFDQFTTEQLAGDLLPNPTTEQLVATGFNRLNMVTREGGAQAKEYLAKYGAERVRTVAGTWLGATFGCAECHDHKYDPISAKDFYSMQAFFADVKQWGVYADYGYTPNPELKGWSNEHPFPPELQVTSDYLKQRIARLSAERSQVARRALQADPQATAKLKTWQKQMQDYLKAHPNGWQELIPESVTLAPATPSKGKKPEKVDPKASVVQPDGRVIFSKGAADNTTMTLPLSAGSLASVRVELLPDPAHKGSILRTGGADSTTMKLTATLHRANTKPTALAFRHADANLKEPRYADGEEVIGIQGQWKTSASKWNQAHDSIWWLDVPHQTQSKDVLHIKIDGNLMGCLRVSVSPLAPPSVKEAKRWFASIAKSLQGEQAAETWLASTGWSPQAWDRYKQLSRDLLECRDGKAWTLITQAVPQPQTVRVLARGNWQDETGEIVPPATPHFLPAKHRTEDRLTRLDLAKWLTSKENPVTARAVMNRLWKQFYGNGLSAVLDDLGAQGEPPSHPELLDWLACEFRDSGWDLRHMIKLMVTSATYQQSSSLRPELRDLDPNNRLLASQNPRRLDAEFIRDNALRVAGLLTLDIGGPSAKPYQPPGYYEALQFPNRDYVTNTDDRQWRRGLYMHWQRTFLHPMLANFDAPNRDESTCTRPGSNTPQQALTLLNDPSFVEAARVFAERLMKEVPRDDAARIRAAYQITLARAPKEKELQSLLTFLNTQRAAFNSGESDASKVLKVGLTLASNSNAQELAAWTSVARVVLNLHETITRY